jgi:hypothetical protein
MKINLKLNGHEIVVEYQFNSKKEVEIENIFYEDKDIKPVIPSDFICFLCDLIDRDALKLNIKRSFMSKMDMF